MKSLHDIATFISKQETSEAHGFVAAMKLAEEVAKPEFLPTGLYKHKAGGLYLVLGIAGLADNGWLQRLAADGEDKKFVVYVSLNPDMEGPRMRIRSLEEFTEKVTWPDTIIRRRFEYIGQEKI